jgi:phosphomevalonate kinase
LLGFSARALAWLEQHGGLRLKSHLTLHVAGAVGGAKVGLGTSAAVTVATLRAVLQDVGAHWSPARIAEAARHIHGAGQGAGSGYDVTTIAMGGCIAYYRTPDHAHHLPWPRGLFGLALFSGEPAPTQAALDKPAIAKAHLDAIDQAARNLLAAWSGPVTGVLSALVACDGAFLQAAADDPDLVPPDVASLRALIRQHGCSPRASGAGGGDCVLAFCDNSAAIQTLAEDWQHRGGHVVAHFPTRIAPEAL